MAGYCQVNGTHEAVNAIENLGFPGHRSAACEVKNTDGAIDVVVLTQAGQWPGAQNATDPDLRAPYINYLAILHTTPAKFDRDIKVFHTVLESVRIGYKQ